MKHFVFVLVTVCLVACGNKASKEVKKTAAPAGTVALSVSATIGVVNSDSILEKYTFAIQARETMTKKAEDARLSLNTKAKQVQNELNKRQVGCRKSKPKSRCTAKLSKTNSLQSSKNSHYS